MAKKETIQNTEPNKTQNMRVDDKSLLHPEGTWQQMTGQQRRKMRRPIGAESSITGIDTDKEAKPDIPNPFKPGVDRERVAEFNKELRNYRSGKHSIEQRTVDAERWWKMRNEFMMDKESGNAKDKGFQAKSSWLHNVITSKHADAMEAYPSPNILPREEGDRVDAWALSKIVPAVLEQNSFEDTYSKAMWQKLKTGTAVYMIVWDNQKLNGMGDVSIKRVSLLNIFWEPGINDIQDSRFVFHVASEDKDLLRLKYPEQLKNMHAMQPSITPTKMPRDDSADTTNKVDVVDVYYKVRSRDGREILHFVKYVGETVLYATENDPDKAERGLYDHGKFPFVFDTLFPVEDSPAGYGFVDICANPQMRIDHLNSAFVKNALVGAMPRYFQRMDGAVNEQEFLDLYNPIVHVSGNLGEDSLRPVDYKPLAGNYITMLDSTVNELRETSGNTETSTGSSTKGVTAASALAALQEASGKGSRDATRSSYRAYSQIVYMVIELIRQFYNMPRQFRITGSMGERRFIEFSNAGMLPQHQGTIGGVDLGMRTPVYDIKVEPEKKSSYTRLAQNELALQFYQLGFFNPNMTDQTLMCLGMMDFDGKDELMQQVQQMGTMFHELQLYKAMASTLAAQFAPQLVPGLLNGAPAQPLPQNPGEKPELDKGTGEASNVSKARERAQTASQPGGSTA